MSMYCRTCGKIIEEDIERFCYDCAILEVNKVKEALAKVIKPEAIDAWLNKPNNAFCNMTPMEVIREGLSYQIYDMITQLEHGIFS